MTNIPDRGGPKDGTSTCEGAPLPTPKPSDVPIAGKGEECAGCFTTVLERFSNSFDKSARRWELIVYPSLFAFIILAMYGFFLIYSLTQDMRSMAVSMDPKMGVNMATLSSDMRSIATNMKELTGEIRSMSRTVQAMGVDTREMTLRIGTMTGQMEALAPMTANMAEMNRSMLTMNRSVDVMNRSMFLVTGTVTHMGRDMNQMSKPVSFMNAFMPW